MNNIFQSLSRQFSFSISYFVGLVEFLTYVIPIMINNLYIFIFIYVLFNYIYIYIHIFIIKIIDKYVII